MPQITLPNGIWWYDDQDCLGPPGGFGAVFRGRSAGDKPVAVKRLHESANHAREMKIADFLLGHGLAHVIPILDAGFDAVAGTHFIIMPIAARSLQQRIETIDRISEGEALEILDSIAAGLEEIGDIIHRDLKPGNILLHEDVWKLADLGLARFAEAATSLNTMRGALTAEYAAPEQWRGERPEKATDVYAFGCIMYAVLQGAPPFAGPDIEHQHQFDVPTGLNSSPHLKRIAAACLAKAPQLRPSVLSLRKQLQTAQKIAKGGGARALAAEAAAAKENALLEEQQVLERARQKQRREQLATEAVQVMSGIFEELKTAVKNEAPDARRGTTSREDGRRLSTGGALPDHVKNLSFKKAVLDYEIMKPFPWMESHPNEDSIPHAGRMVGSSEWDVLAAAYISVHTKDRPWKGRSANLWFGRLREGDDYRWWEVSYVYPDGWTFHDKSLREPEPFGLRRGLPSTLEYLVSEDPRPITSEFVEDFLDRWIGFFAEMASGNDHRIDASFPKRFPRQTISPEFKLDKP